MVTAGSRVTHALKSHAFNSNAGMTPHARTIFSPEDGQSAAVAAVEQVLNCAKTLEDQDY
jgi:hypothetical protein